MKAVFLKEHTRVSRAEFVRLIGLENAHATKTIDALLQYGILKLVRPSRSRNDLSESLEDDFVLFDAFNTNETHYVITFVGLLIIDNCVLKCYPKYLSNDARLVDNLAQILRVLELYNSRHQLFLAFDGESRQDTPNALGVMIYILRDYFEHGSYIRTKDIVENNGLGEIHWDRTINETSPILLDGRPHYVDLRTKRRLSDNYDFFKRLHESIVVTIITELRRADLLSILNLPDVDLVSDTIDTLGDRDYLLSRIEGELGIQFNTRKQLVLKGLHSYLSEYSAPGEATAVRVFGTTSFNLVWESVCSSVIGNHLTMPLFALPLPARPHPQYDAASTLQALIDKPYWIGSDSAGHFLHASDHTLRPDLVALVEADGIQQLFICDAKYYAIQLRRDHKLMGQPGIEDVTKQYLYQQAFRKFADLHGIREIRNCFLMPTDRDEIIALGRVSLEMLSSLGLEDISIRLLPATTMFELYLQGKRMDLSQLKL